MAYSNRALFGMMQNLANQYKNNLEIEFSKSGIGAWALSHAAILEISLKQNSIGMQELAQKIQRDKSTLTVLVNKLEQQGYLSRCKEGNDKRNTRIRSTDKSKILLSKIRNCQKKVEQKIITNLDSSEKKILFKLITKISVKQ